MSYLVLKGKTNVSVTIRIIDSGDGTPENGVVFDTTGIDLWYRRDGAVSVDITEADLSTPALTDAHADGGFLLINDGYYRLDLPDLACASGVDQVVVGGTVTGMIVIGLVIQLVDFDPFDTVRMGLTALPNAAADAAGGLPISDDGGLDMDAKLAATNEVTAVRMAALTDWINGGRLDSLLDAIPTTVMRGTDSAALASVLGTLSDAAAADDPTSSDTVMQYLKQLINILIGAVGIANLRAAADPANAVSLSEMIRAIFDDTNTLSASGTGGSKVAAPPYLGDYQAGATVRFQWPSQDAGGASITRATNGEVRVYKDNAVAQSTAGVTDNEDFDSLTGDHAVDIDTSADPTFYSPGSDYTVVLQGATIDGETVNTPLAHFSIENRVHPAVFEA